MKKVVSLVMVFAMLATLFVMPASADGQNVVNVSSVEEIKAALASDTKLVLAPGRYVFESDIEYMTFDDGTSWEYEIPRCLEISELSNVTIEGNGQAEIVLDVGYEAVIRVENSENIVLSGLTLGHAVPESSCAGDGYVINLLASNNVTIQNCDLYGCGVNGINAYGSGNITVNNTIIRDCMMNAVCLFGVTGDVTFNDCTFSGNAYERFFAEYTPCFEFSRDEERGATSSVSFNNCTFADNKSYIFMGTSYSNEKLDWVSVNGCTFTNNAWDSTVDVVHNKYGYWESVPFSDQRPAILNDRTMVPLRSVLEVLDYTVEWDADTQTATISRDDIPYEIAVTINSNVIYKDGTAIEIDVPACIMNDRTMIPLRAISEAFDMGVDWNATTRTVSISVQ